jgi:hypothetical protein
LKFHSVNIISQKLFVFFLKRGFTNILFSGISKNSTHQDQLRDGPFEVGATTGFKSS